MGKAPPKLSGLIKSGSVVPAVPLHALPDLPAARSAQAREADASEGESAAPAVVGERHLQQISLELIDPNPLAPREVYTPEMILQRAENLRTQGQHDPIHVIPHPDVPGRFIICDGWTRVQACREHKVFASLLAEIHLDLSLEESAWFGYEQNECRQQHCDFDRAMFYEKLIVAGESASDIARRAKLSKTLMSFYRAYARLPEDLLELVRQHPEKFGANAAYQLLKVHEKCGQRRAVSLANKFAAEDQPLRWLSNQAQALLNPSGAKSASPSKQIKYSNGYYKQRGDVFEVSIAVPDHKRLAFATALENLLDTVAVVLAPESEKTDAMDKPTAHD
ncbi:ParB/RepB/Spo0J family partition protein [Comamonas endophytica]|uniref:ParB N-terminal domain-containing protein n=1 Tax=Comamonas endophytica TaxID=2949090 RepID=A0ABY6GG79_9BURK|nr:MULTISPECIES: ParB N-terminal domain-containing protein [unclassified Acidovorax]MCD2514395.1 ParB N-terminal domain-containing protein [Acidovorax sp. D4N7]UYG53685.1 ParB N-terminal domain-containing protein [Acidovorax sp. 5MLIR]